MQSSLTQHRAVTAVANRWQQPVVAAHRRQSRRADVAVLAADSQTPYQAADIDLRVSPTPLTVNPHLPSAIAGHILAFLPLQVPEPGL